MYKSVMSTSHTRPVKLQNPSQHPPLPQPFIFPPRQSITNHKSNPFPTPVPIFPYPHLLFSSQTQRNQFFSMARQVKKLNVQFFSSSLRESIFILRSSPYTFTLITLTIVLPLSFAILVHNLVTQPPFFHLQLFSSNVSQWSLLLLHQFAYLLFLFTFSILSISSVFFTVASFYTSKPITIPSILSTIPLVFPRIFKTLLCVSIIMLLYYTTLFLSILALLVLVPPSLYCHLFVFTLAIIVVLFLMVYVYISILSHFTNVVSVLESECGLTTMKRSHELLHGMMEMASDFVIAYLVVCVAILEAFKEAVVKGPEEEGGLEIRSGPKILIGGTIMWILVLVNLLGLLFQGMFYYVCKTHHHEGIENNVLYDHLDGYLGDNKFIESSVEIGTV